MNYVGIDVGSSSTKGVLVSDEFKIIRRAYKSHNLSVLNGKSTVNPEIFYKETIEIIKELVDDSFKNKISKIIISGFESISFIGINGLEVIPAMTYLDTRADLILKDVKKIIDDETIFSISKNRVSSIFEGYKLIYAFMINKRKFGKVWKVLDVPRYVSYRLTGKGVIDKTAAMLFAPFYDVNKEDWNEDFIESFKIDRNIFPEIYESHEEAGIIKNDLGEKLNIKDATVLTGAQDAYSQMLSSGIIDENEASLIYGTTAVFDLIHSGKKFSKNFVNTRHIVPGKYIIEAAMFNTGSLISWFEKTFNIKVKEMDKKIIKLKRPSNIITVPFFSGERAPIWNNNIKGSINYIDLNTKTEDIYLSVLEAMGYWLKYVISELESLDFTIEKIYSSGGGTVSKIWPKIVSDISDRKQLIVKDAGAEMGDVFIGLYSDRVIKNYREIKDMVKIGKKVEPNDAINKMYLKNFKIFNKLINK